MSEKNLEARVEIKEELAVKGLKRALRKRAITNVLRHQGINLLIIWIVIASVDGMLGAANLIFWHFLAAFGIWLVSSYFSYQEWLEQVSQTEGWSFYAELDKQGVITKVKQEERFNWDYYKNFKEYEDYLEIEDINGNISFLPKNPELFELIEFTKENIPEK